MACRLLSFLSRDPSLAFLYSFLRNREEELISPVVYRRACFPEREREREKNFVSFFSSFLFFPGRIRYPDGGSLRDRNIGESYKRGRKEERNARAITVNCAIYRRSRVAMCGRLSRIFLSIQEAHMQYREDGFAKAWFPSAFTSLSPRPNERARNDERIKSSRNVIVLSIFRRGREEARKTGEDHSRVSFPTMTNN